MTQKINQMIEEAIKDKSKNNGIFFAEIMMLIQKHFTGDFPLKIKAELELMRRKHMGDKG